MNYDTTRPWLSLDPWQKKYIESPAEQNNLLLCARQVGKTTAMSIRAVELCIKHFKKGEFVLINSITEKQAYHMLAKAHVYAKEKYAKNIVIKGPNKPTKHKLNFRNGTGILCYAAGETGMGLRGFTIKKLMIDEGSRMSEEFFIAVQPMISVIRGSMDIASTPAGKLHKDGSQKFFYKCYLNDKFTKFYVSADDCPRHAKDFLEEQRKNLSRLAYAQEYMAIFTDELLRIFDDGMIKSCCIMKREKPSRHNPRYLGVDVAGFGKDECTFEIVERNPDGYLFHRDSIIEKRNLTTDTTRKIFELEKMHDFSRIGVDDAGIGFGVFSELMDDDRTKRKTVGLNNASRVSERRVEKGDIKYRKKKLLKEEMYMLLMTLMEKNRIHLLDDDEVRASLSSIQFDEDGKIFGSYSHIVEGIIRAVWLAEKEKHLNIWIM